MLYVTELLTHSRWSRLYRVIALGALLALGTTALAETLNRLSDVFTYMPTPRYPSDAWWRSGSGWRRIEGRTVCRVTLSADGTVAQVEIASTSGSKILDHASIDALRVWRAKPGRAGRYYHIPINFNGRVSAPELPVPNDGLGLSRGR